MQFIDTHCHLYLPQFDEDREAMLQRAQSASVDAFFLPNVDAQTIAPMLALEKAHPDHCFPMMGLHPCSVNADFEEALALVENWWERRDFVAVGEIGLDYYWSTDFVKEQKTAFREQCRLAQRKDRPIVIHARDSIDDLIALVAEEQQGNLRGVFHCFTGTQKQAQQIIDLGFFLGLGGVLTFKNSGVDKAIADIDLTHFVLETDAPYLSPTPHRGKRNESAYIPLVAQKLAAVKGCSLEEVAQTTTANAQKLYATASLPA